LGDDKNELEKSSKIGITTKINGNKMSRITIESNGKYLSVMPFARVGQNKSVSRQTSRRHRASPHLPVWPCPQIFPLTRALSGPRDRRSEKENPEIGTDFGKIQKMRENANIVRSAYSHGIGKLNLGVNQLKVPNEKN